jgi:23S rRNA (cytosine1962-C5)-methyltransferase
LIRWKVRRGREQSVRQGHPWIMRDDLEAIGKDLVPGTLVEVVDYQNQLLGWGYGNHESRIAVRLLSRKSDDRKGLTIDFFIDRVLEAWRRKKELGVRQSFRLVYSEGDEMPGLICDRYIAESNGIKFQVFSVQISTAGMGRILMDPVTFFRRVAERAQAAGWSEFSWDQSVVVIRNDSPSRKHEGLEVEFPRVVKSVRDIELNDCQILVRSTHGGADLKFSCDLYQGQKTGFFLDQFQNIFLVNEEIGRRSWNKSEPVQILDLCCYVGHWSAQLSRRLLDLGYKVQVTLVDVSTAALEKAARNIRELGLEPTVLKKDVLKELGDLPAQTYHVVIGDPPAFAKSKKDIPHAEHAYMKLSAQAFRVAKSEGLVAACSCSGAVREDDFAKAVAKGLLRSERSARLLQTGGHAPDHPLLDKFPEGYYLKMNLFEVL